MWAKLTENQILKYRCSFFLKKINGVSYVRKDLEEEGVNFRNSVDREDVLNNLILTKEWGVYTGEII